MVRRVLSFLLCVMALIGAAGAHAQGRRPVVAVSVCVRPAPPAATLTPRVAAALLRSGDGFDCVTPQRALGRGDFWVRSTPLPRGPGLVPTFVRSSSVLQARATLAIAYADGVVVLRRIDDVAAARSVVLGSIFQQPIPVRGVRAVRLAWHIEESANVRAVMPQVRIVGPGQARWTDLVLTSLYSAFAGLSLALLVYNLSLWAAMRHRFQLHYCAMVMAMLGYAFTSSGAFSWLWPELGNVARVRANYALLAAAGVSAIAFARDFLERRVFAGVMGPVSCGVMVLLGGTGAAFLVIPLSLMWLFSGMFVATVVTVLALAIAVLVRAWRVRSNYLWLFAIAWAVPIVFAAVRIVIGHIPVRWTLVLDNSALAAMVVEALLSSLAVAYRIRLLLVERDQAREQEMAARLLADIDPLTGLLNRRAFLREAIGSSSKRILLLADVDHFKEVNETLGHDGGDEVLRRVADALRAAALPGALVARIGGEEFAILSPGAEAPHPEAVLAAVRATAMPFDLRVTVSLGSASGVIATEPHWAEIYRRADGALFAAKRAGRDRARRAETGSLAA